MISIVIVNWNSGPLLENCVRSLLKNAAGCEILIVDNASRDSSLHFVEEIPGGISVLSNSRNIGFAAANNVGWRASKGDRILFLNPDTECFPGSVDRLDETLAADKAIWAAGGQLIGPSGDPQTGFNVRAFPSIQSVAAETFFLDKIWPSNPWSGVNRTAGMPETDVDQPAAACLMVSRDAIEAIDGFDESFRPAWFEDVDLCRRIRKEGGRIRYQPRAQFLHHGGYSLQKLSQQDFLEAFHGNQILYFQKHYGIRAAETVRRIVVAGLFLRSAVSLALPLVPRQSRADSAKTFWRAALYLSHKPEPRP